MSPKSIIRNVTRTPDRLVDSSKPLDPVWTNGPAFFSSGNSRTPGAFHSSDVSNPSSRHILKVDSSQWTDQEQLLGDRSLD